MWSMQLIVLFIFIFEKLFGFGAAPKVEQTPEEKEQAEKEKKKDKKGKKGKGKDKKGAVKKEVKPILLRRD